MCVASKPSLMPAWTMSIAAVCAPSPPEPASLSEMSLFATWEGNDAQKRGAFSSPAPISLRTRPVSKVGLFVSHHGSRVSSFFTPSGKIGSMHSSTHFSVSSGVFLRCVGHSARTSTNEKPRFSTWFWSALWIAFLARLRCLGLKRATRST
jgi:hypothetical protein